MNDLVVTLPAVLEILTIIERELNRDPRLVSQHSRRVYHQALKMFEIWRGPRPMTRLLVEEYAADLRRREYAPATINRALSAVRWWAKRVRELAFEDPCMERGLRDEIAVQAERVTNVSNVKGARMPKGRHLADGEVRRLLAACAKDSTLAGRRDQALIAIAWSTGARQAELAGIEVTDISLDPDTEEGVITIRHGKGDKERQVSLHGGSFQKLEAWLRERGSEDGFAFCPLRRGGHLCRSKRMGHEAMRQLLLDRQRQAGLTKPVTWHDFRRTFIGNLLNAGVDLATAQKLAGHSDSNTTARYDRRGEEVQREAARRLQLPFS